MISKIVIIKNYFTFSERMSQNDRISPETILLYAYISLYVCVKVCKEESNANVDSRTTEARDLKFCK